MGTPPLGSCARVWPPLWRRNSQYPIQTSSASTSGCFLLSCCFSPGRRDVHLAPPFCQGDVESDKVFPEIPFLQAKNSQLSQPLLITFVLQTCHQLLWTLSYIPTSCVFYYCIFVFKWCRIIGYSWRIFASEGTTRFTNPAAQDIPRIPPGACQNSSWSLAGLNLWPPPWAACSRAKPPELKACGSCMEMQINEPPQEVEGGCISWGLQDDLGHPCKISLLWMSFLLGLLSSCDLAWQDKSWALPCQSADIVALHSLHSLFLFLWFFHESQNHRNLELEGIHKDHQVRFIALPKKTPGIQTLP